MKYIPWLIVALLLTGCADSGTRGDSNMREYRDLVRIDGNTGTITMHVYLSAASDMETQSTQDVKSAATVSPRTSAALYGGTASQASDGAELLVEGIESLWQQWQDNRKTDSDNPVDNSTTTTPVPVIIPENEKVPVNPEEVLTDGDYQTEFQHTTADAGHGGTSLKLCPDQVMDFDSCKAGDTDLPRHDSDGQEGYWNMTDVSMEDIVCTKGDATYKYPGGKEMVKGDCK